MGGGALLTSPNLLKCREFNGGERSVAVPATVGMMQSVDWLPLLRTSFPRLEFRDARVVDDGWDSLVLDLDDEWIVRLPRRPEVERWVEREIALLPELAPRLPVAVPHFELVARHGRLGVAYRKIHGSPAKGDLSEQTGNDLGQALSALHAFPLERARAVGVPYFEPAAWREHFTRLCGDFGQRVVPLLRPGEREQAETLFAQIDTLDFSPALLHADLGPAHVLCRDGRLAGIIDWSDARVGDPALDLAWCLNGTAHQVADAVARVYGVDGALRGRSLFYHQLGPWYEVTYGLDTNQEPFVRSGLEGVRSRLPR